MKLTVITPTVGEPTLAATIDSVKGQLKRGDEMLVVGDGPQPVAKALVDACGKKSVRYLETAPDLGGWGNPQRTFAIAQARGDYLMFCDADDVLVPDALEAARQAAGEAPGAMHIFRMRLFGYPWAEPGLELWRFPLLMDGNQGTPCLVVPNRDDLPPWAPNRYNADFAWALAVKNMGVEVVWQEKVIAITRPHMMPEKFKSLPTSSKADPEPSPLETEPTESDH